ncbi:UDP-N-acetylmuramoyl-tripeptide--D-alanyl-D-alanine ligase [Candidatus Gottesmanbacteria bacterium]|nr:UDP-N-acetylmuramoyl-tripeptide--D-alanyl-D-alanine ligase [Candidatus Gottesmanbacteria bacterium]
MELLILSVAFVWGVRIVLNILTYAEVWWVKEYRWDRMLIHLHTPQGRRFWWPLRRRPPITPKSTLLVFLSLMVSAWLVWSIRIPILFRFAIADALSFPMTWILVLLLNAPVKLYHTVLIALAVRKLRSHKPMTVIGITGSFGKTSVKDYLATILSAKFKVLKTEASKNSPIGIVEVIIKSLMPEHDVFVVEMGAYKIGEIADMAAIVKPQIGIVTAINLQHQDLFGTLDNTMKAKYELIAGLTGKRIAIMNAADERVRTMAGWARRDGCDVWEGRIRTTDIKAGFDGISVTAHMGKEKANVRARVVGKHQSTNIVLAMEAAVAAGMMLPEAALATSHIQPAAKVLEIVPGVNGSMFINDTFNNNPDAVKAALDVLAWVKGRKYLVFQPMIELGSYAAQSHESVGEYAGRICDEIVLTNRNYYEDFVRGVRKAREAIPVSVMSPEKAAEIIRNTVGKGDAVLFKGKEADHVLRELD